MSSWMTLPVPVADTAGRKVLVFEQGLVYTLHDHVRYTLTSAVPNRT